METRPGGKSGRLLPDVCRSRAVDERVSRGTALCVGRGPFRYVEILVREQEPVQASRTGLPRLPELGEFGTHYA
jgi:hypothetical protein